MKTLFDTGCKYAVVGGIRYKFDGIMLWYTSQFNDAWTPLMRYTDHLWGMFLRLHGVQEHDDENAV